MHRILAPACLMALAVATAPARAAGPGTFAEQVDAACAKYDGHPSFEVDGKQIDASCAWIHAYADSLSAEPFALYDGIFRRVQRLDDVATAQMPSDVRCPATASRGATGLPEVRCTVDVGTSFPLTLEGDAQGRLVAISMVFPYRDLQRHAAESAVARGKITTFHDAFVDVPTELNVANWRAHLPEGGTLAFDGNRVDLRLVRPADGDPEPAPNSLPPPPEAPPAPPLPVVAPPPPPPEAGG